MSMKLFGILLIIFILSTLIVFTVSCNKPSDTIINTETNNQNKQTNPANAPGVYRSFSKNTAAINEEITVTLNVVMDGSKFYIIDEKIPEGATAYEPNKDGSTEDKGHVKWVVTHGASDTTYTYKIKFTNPGDNVFRGDYIFESMDSSTAMIKGDNIIIVQ
ncbi:MAG: hypothetical protein QXG00_01780 [Candidatus Woesearchaeota archaeon]